MSDKLSDGVTRAWVRLVQARHAVVSAVEADAKAAAMLPLEWYDVLWDLERHEEGVRPFELEQRLLFAQYNLSRLVDRMVEAGLVKKAACPSDKRGHMLHITEAGRKARKATWPHYARSVNKHLGDKLSEAETEKLATLLGKLMEQSQRT
ncbi:MAG TPA: helix-turn-helix domain-containing protein [Dongiaceae bacterium]